MRVITRRAASQPADDEVVVHNVDLHVQHAERLVGALRHEALGEAAQTRRVIEAEPEASLAIVVVVVVIVRGKSTQERRQELARSLARTHVARVVEEHLDAHSLLLAVVAQCTLDCVHLDERTSNNCILN